MSLTLCTHIVSKVTKYPQQKSKLISLHLESWYSIFDGYLQNQYLCCLCHFFALESSKVCTFSVYSYTEGPSFPLEKMSMPQVFIRETRKYQASIVEGIWPKCLVKIKLRECLLLHRSHRYDMQTFKSTAICVDIQCLKFRTKWSYNLIFKWFL